VDKKKTVVRIGGAEYALQSDNSEEYMHRVAIYVDRVYKDVTQKHPHLNTSMAAVLAAVNIADELLRERGELNGDPASGTKKPPGRVTNLEFRKKETSRKADDDF